MSSSTEPPEIQARVERALQLEDSGQVLQAELLYLGVLQDLPGSAHATSGVARLALRRGDPARAIQFLQSAVQANPNLGPLGVDLAVAQLAAGQPAQAVATLEALLGRVPGHAVAWLLLGKVREQLGDASGALKAWYQAVTRALRAGEWRDERNTPLHLVDAISSAKEKVRLGRRELFFGSYEDLRQQYGSQELRRVDRALTGYLRDWDATPIPPRQRPTFMYFPDLPNTPFHEPYLQPWAERLQAEFPRIRAEALRVLAEDSRLPDFVEVPEGRRMVDYVSGDGQAPAWEAFFFYRHGERFNTNHLRCPETSAVLESIELCRIADQAPEILFSVLKPGSHIMPHYGVSNVRLVMHLPLQVPPDCALNVVDAGEHHWQEGCLMMFDDTYLHEAWNRSDTTRVILLMDCWNPHLSVIERRAVQRLIETISALSLANRPHKNAGEGV